MRAGFMQSGNMIKASRIFHFPPEGEEGVKPQ